MNNMDVVGGRDVVAGGDVAGDRDFNYNRYLILFKLLTRARRRRVIVVS